MLWVVKGVDDQEIGELFLGDMLYEWRLCAHSDKLRLLRVTKRCRNLALSPVQLSYVPLTTAVSGLRQNQAFSI